jgi:two-component system NarL family sensor kinase
MIGNRMRIPAMSWPSPRSVAAGTAASIAIAIVLIGQWAGPTDSDAGPVAITAAVALSCTAMGAIALTAVPKHLVGRLLLAAGVSASIGAAAVSWTTWEPLAWLSQWSWWPAYGLLFLALLYFPDGRLPGRRWRPLAVLLAGSTALGSLALAVAALDEPRTLLSRIDVPLTPRAQLLIRVFAVFLLLTVVGLVGVISSLWARWRRADGDTRQQLACLLPAVVLLLVGLILDTLNLSGGYIVATVAVPLGMTVAVIRYRLYDLDRILNRTIVWLIMTLLVVAGFVAIVTVLRELIVRNASPDSVSLLTTGLIAVVYAPLHRWVQQGVNQLLYGDRHDPYKVIAGLGDVLGQTAEPNAVLPLLTGTIARSLQVPYVAVEIEEQQGARLLAWYGRVGPTIEAFDMISRGEQIGRLLVSPRTDGGHFTPREARLLADIALHAGVAVEASQLTQDLQDSRERLVQAREEERRRLRRDLHDGLGPSLTGMSMQVRAARKMAGTGRLREILDALAADLAACTAEVRQLVDELRPAALDRGLTAALRDECRRFDSSALSVQLDLHDDVDRLPAAVEVAAYRVVAEALNNVARHAGASEAVVSVRRGRELTVEITDDGIGLAAPYRAGVGLASMRDRAGELGGEFEIVPAEPRGTTVRVRFPAASLMLAPEREPASVSAAGFSALAASSRASASVGAVRSGTAPVLVGAPAAAPLLDTSAVAASPAVSEGSADPADPVDGSGGPEEGGAQGAPVRLWTGGVVPYEVAPELAAEQHIPAAIAHLESRTSLRFVPRTAEDSDYVRFVRGGSFASRVGRVGGEQEIVVSAGGEMGQVLHELGHTLGRWHEHCRSDRDSYVAIKWQNVQPAALPNFLIQAFGPEQGPYDYESIMHYPRIAFSINGERTLETLQPVPPGLPVGQRQQLSDGDCQVFERMYQDVPASPDQPVRTLAAEAPADEVGGALELPAGYPSGLAASVRVSVRDTTLTGGPVRTVGETTLTDVELAGGGQIPFRVPVSDVDPSAVYTIEAHVDVTGAGVVEVGDLITAQACAVLTGGAPTELAVPLARVV